MDLQTAENLGRKSVTQSQLIDAFADDYGRGEFIILTNGPKVFIQAAGEGNGPYMLEYRLGEDQYKCSKTLTKTEVLGVFQKYLKSDNSWKSDFSWQKLEMKPWWKLW